MSVILIEKDPFVESESTISSTNKDESVNVRRPLYGIQVKTARPAFLSLYQDGGDASPKKVSLVDTSAPGGYSFANHNFILQGVQDTRQEKVQIVETFGDHYAFFFGAKPIVLVVQGMLINTADFNWKNEFLRNYEDLLRGTKCVENRTRVFLGWDDVLAQGYIMNCQVNYSADNPYVCPFSFQMLLAKAPLDLSMKFGAFDYVTMAEEARTLVSDKSAAVEYIGALSDGSEKAALLDENGNVVEASLASDKVPQSIDNIRSATWVSGQDPKKQQWKTAGEALMDLNTSIAANQNGSNEVTAVQALRANPGAFPLASRTTSVASLEAALSSGVANAAAVISDSPALE